MKTRGTAATFLVNSKTMTITGHHCTMHAHTIPQYLTLTLARFKILSRFENIQEIFKITAGYVSIIDITDINR